MGERRDVFVARDVVEIAVLGQAWKVGDRDVDQAARNRGRSEPAQRLARVAEVFEGVLNDDELERRFSRDLVEQRVPGSNRGSRKHSGLDPGRFPAVCGEHVQPAPDPATEIECAASSGRKLGVRGEQRVVPRVAHALPLELRCHPFWLDRDPSVPAFAFRAVVGVELGGRRRRRRKDESATLAPEEREAELLGHAWLAVVDRIDVQSTYSLGTARDARARRDEQRQVALRSHERRLRPSGVRG